jgi:hypothetical protein
MIIPGDKNWSQWPGLNRRPTVYETVALPLSYIGFLRDYCCAAQSGDQQHQELNKPARRLFVKTNMQITALECRTGIVADPAVAAS